MPESAVREVCLPKKRPAGSRRETCGPDHTAWLGRTWRSTVKERVGV
jgi:hypothetical protein